MALPVCDLSPLRHERPDPRAIAALSHQLHLACLHTGFLYISGTGLSASDIQGLLHLAGRFFDLPQASKEAMDASKSQLARGYNSLEHGKHNCTPEDGQQDVKESFTVGVERAPGDPRPPSPMHGPNQWPPEGDLPGWRQEVLASFDALLGVARLLMRGLALALHQPDNFYTDKCRDPVAQMVLFRYPPTGGGDAAQRGCGAHTDCGFLTFVAQDAPGIEVLLPNGTWYCAPSLPGTLLVNLGDMMARWTGDAYRSTVHRVVNRSAAVTRHSLVFFCNTDFDALVETVPVPPEGAHTAAAGGAATAATPPPMAVAAAVADGSSGADIEGPTAAAAAAASLETAAAGCGVRQYPPIKAGHYILEKLGLMWDQPPTS